MSKRKIVVFSHLKLEEDLVYGRLPLKAVPQKIRLRNRIFYSYAMKYYNWRQDVDNPYDVFYQDICSLPEGCQKERLIDLYNLYGSDLGLSYQRQKTDKECFAQDAGGLILGGSGWRL